MSPLIFGAKCFCESSNSHSTGPDGYMCGFCEYKIWMATWPRAAKKWLPLAPDCKLKARRHPSGPFSHIFKCTRPPKCSPPHPLFSTPKTLTCKILEGWLAWTPPTPCCVAKGPWDLRCKEKSTRSSRHHDQFNSACKSLPREWPHKHSHYCCVCRISACQVRISCF